MPWEWGDPGGVAVSEQPELADNRICLANGGLERWIKQVASSLFRGITNGTALDAPDGVLTSCCTGVLGSSRRDDAGRDPVGITRLDGLVRRGSLVMIEGFDSFSMTRKRLVAEFEAFWTTCPPCEARVVFCLCFSSTCPLPASSKSSCSFPPSFASSTCQIPY